MTFLTSTSNEKKNVLKNCGWKKNPREKHGKWLEKTWKNMEKTWKMVGNVHGNAGDFFHQHHDGESENQGNGQSRMNVNTAAEMLRVPFLVAIGMCETGVTSLMTQTGMLNDPDLTIQVFLDRKFVMFNHEFCKMIHAPYGCEIRI